MRGANEPLWVLDNKLILQAANAVKAATVGAGTSLLCTGTVYIIGRDPGSDDILNRGIN